MNKMQYKVVGKKVTTSKKGNLGYTYYLMHDFDEYWKANANELVGHCVSEIFTTFDVNVKPGDVVELDYMPGFQGKATVSAINVIASK